MAVTQSWAATSEQDAVDAAAARIKAAEFIAAINALGPIVDAIERRGGRYAVELARPLTVLGDALVGMGDRSGALGAYNRALHITRVNRGLHHPSQVDIVYREAALLAAGGEYRTANRRHEYAYRVLLRSYGGGNPLLLPGVFALADWYLLNYNIFAARALYEHAAQLAASHLSPADPSRTRALRGIAASYRSERFPPFHTHQGDVSTFSSHTGFRYRSTPGKPAINSFAKGERALIEVVNIVQAQRGASGEKLATAMLELGDWFLMFEKYSRAIALYRRVWELLQPSPALLARTFKRPTPLYMPMPRDPRKPDHVMVAKARDGVVELRVAVNPRGFVSHIDTLRSEPKDLMDFKVRRAVKRARYRPAFDGETPLATEDVRIKHSFVYYPSPQAGLEVPETSTNDAGLTATSTGVSRSRQ